MITLDDYKNDIRLSRLLKTRSKKVTLCLWILEDKSKSVNYYLLYGRLLPSSFSSSKWTGSDGKKYKNIGDHSFRILPITISIDTKIVVKLIDLLLLGNKISVISELMELSYINDKFKKIIEGIYITIDAIFSPIAFLLPRVPIDTSEKRSIDSESSCYSGLILNKNKMLDITKFTQSKDDIFSEIIDSLNLECALNFYEQDAFRLCALEICNIPNYDDKDKECVLFNNDNENNRFTVIIKKGLAVGTSKLLCKLEAVCAKKNVYSNTKTHKYNKNNDSQIEFFINQDINDMADYYILELSHYDSSNKCYIPYFYHEYRYIKSVQISINHVGTTKVIGQGWLNKFSSTATELSRATNIGRVAQQDDVKNNLIQIWHKKTDFIDIENDNYQYQYQKKQEVVNDIDAFFEHYQNHSAARLDFSEWYINTIHNEKHKKVVIFDPYYEDAGLYLLIPKANKKTEYIIITTINESVDKIGNDFAGVNIYNSTSNPNDRISKLKESLLTLSEHLTGLKISIYALPPISPRKPAFHDRYHFIEYINGDLKGFNFSNSIQKANENYPLLITSISNKTLIKLSSYIETILEKNKLVKDNALVDYCIYDSTIRQSNQPRIDALEYLHDDFSGKILAYWTGDFDLFELTGDKLVNTLKDKKIIKDSVVDTSHFTEHAELLTFLESLNPLENFINHWSAFCSILAHNNNNDSQTPLAHIKSEILLKFLTDMMLSGKEDYTHDQYKDYSFVINDIEYFAKHSITFEDFASRTDYNLSWSFRYAIDYILENNSSYFLKLIDDIHSKITTKKATDYEWFVFKKLIEKLSFYLIFIKDEPLTKLLLSSKLNILKWFGLLSLFKPSETSDTLAEIDKYLTENKCIKNIKLKFYSWILINNSRKSKDNTLSYKNSAFYNTYLSWLIDNYENDQLPLSNMVNIFTGNLGYISWIEPSFSDDIIDPLITSKTTDITTVTKIWFNELYNYLSRFVSKEPHNNTFSINKEGMLLNYSIKYLLKSQVHEINVYIMKLNEILGKASRIIRTKLSRNANWTYWDNATKSSLIIHIIFKEIKSAEIENTLELEPLMSLSYELIGHRNDEDWFSMRSAGNEYAYLFM